MNRLKVLLVEDSEEFASAATRHLAALPWIESIGRAHDGAEAVALVPRLEPDLVLMNLAMLPMGGCEATRRIKRLPRSPHIVMLAPHDSAEYRHYARVAGAAGYLAKREFQDHITNLVNQMFGPPPGEHRH